MSRSLWVICYGKHGHFTLLANLLENLILLWVSVTSIESNPDVSTHFPFPSQCDWYPVSPACAKKEIQPVLWTDLVGKSAPMEAFLFWALNAHECEQRGNVTNRYLQWSQAPRNSDSGSGWGTQGYKYYSPAQSLASPAVCVWTIEGVVLLCPCAPGTRGHTSQAPGRGDVWGSNIWINHLLFSFLILIFVILPCNEHILHGKPPRYI